MKKLLLILFLITINISLFAQLHGSHYYAKPRCTTLISSIGSTQQTIGSSMTSNGGGKIVQTGILIGGTNPVRFSNYSIQSSSTFNNGELSNWYTTYNFSPGTSVYFVAFITSVSDTTYGDTMLLTVPSTITPPTLNLTAVSNIGTTTATSGGNTIISTGSSVTAKGVCWIDSSVGETPTTSNSKTNDGSGSTNFTSSITGLSPGHTYYIRAYATNSSGTGYSERFQFTTSLTQQQPELTTNVISSIENTSAVSGGVITFDGNATIVEKGVCYSTTPSPTYSNSKTNEGAGSNSFTSILTGLSENTLYYVRAYARNARYSNGVYTYVTGYGNERSFTTTTSYSVPTLTTETITAITYNSAFSGGNVSSVGSTPIIDRGVCYATHQNPTLSDYSVSSGSGQLGGYSSFLSGLSANTTYYVRAYATNSNGTGYGNQLSFTTVNNCVLPSFSSASCVNPTSYSIDVNATINSNSCGITSRGFQYSTDSQFNTVLGSVAVGSGSGSYSTTITGLSCGTHYYFRPWATNSAGTYYANDLIGSGCTTIIHQEYALAGALDNTASGSACFNGDFTSSFSLACQVKSEYFNLSCHTNLGGRQFRTQSGNLSVGEKLYSFSGCQETMTGYWLNNSLDVVYIVNGVIQSITTCP